MVVGLSCKQVALICVYVCACVKFLFSKNIVAAKNCDDLEQLCEEQSLITANILKATTTSYNNKGPYI